MSWLRGLAACALMAGCGGASSPGSSDLAAASDMGPPACVDPSPAPGSVCGVPVSGNVVDENGAAVGALTVSVCAGECFFGTTLSDGSFTVVPDLHILLSQYALELHGRPDRVSYYAPLPSSMPVAFSAPLLLPSLPATGPEIVNDGTAQTVTSGDLTVSIAAGTQVFFDVEDFGTPNGHQLRVLTIDDATKFPFVGTPPDALYACSPFEIAFSQKASLTLANRANLPAGAAVDVQQLVGLVNDGPPAGRLVHAANAHVSADGMTVQTDSGEGVTELTWLALRKM